MSRESEILERLRAQKAERDHLADVMAQLHELVKDGLPTTLTKWAALGAKLIKILAEAVIE